MAKSHESKKPKSSIFLCCFGSFPHETSMKESDHNNNKLSSDSKTVPLDVSLPEADKVIHRAQRVRKWTLFFKSTSKPRSNHQKPLKKYQTPVTNHKTPRQKHPVVSITPNQAPRHENENGLPRVDTPQEEAREESISVPARSHSDSVSLPAPKRHRERQTPLKSAVRSGNARRYESNDSAFGLSVILVTLVIVIVWGRFCAIPCTSAWLYMFPRIRRVAENDIIKNLNNVVSKELDLDSEVHKKKVVLEGLLDRNRRVRHENSGN